MTDIEIKGKELIEKFRPHAWQDESGYEDPKITETICAKACALICCDQVLDAIGYPTYFHETRAFWQSVRAYIEGSK